MKKALSLLLAVAMLASMSTVPAWAEDEMDLDIPVIEEVTEEEMEEEVELFGEAVTEETTGETNLKNVTWHTYVPAEGDGVTYFTELEGSSVSVFNVMSATTQGNLASITNGIYTTGVEIEDPSANSEVDHYPVVNNATEGFMGNNRKNALTIDFGAEKTFAGIRIMDSHKARAMKSRKATKVYVSISSDGTNWTTVDTSDVAVARGKDYETTYSDFFFRRLNRTVNLTARYIRVYVSNVNNHDQFDIEEIIMLDADSAKDTYNPVTAKDYYDFDENWTIEIGSSFGGAKGETVFDGVIFGGQGNCWHSIANAEGHTYTEADKTITITFDKPTEIGGVRIFPRTDQLGANPNIVKILATLDGDTWHTIWASKTVGFTTTAMEGKEVYFPFGREYPLMGLKVVSLVGIDANLKQYTNYTELQLLKPALPTAQDPDFHVFPDDEVTMGLPIGTFATYGVKEGAADTVFRGTDVGYKAFEGIALTSKYFTKNGSPGGGFSTYQLHHDYCIAGEGVTLTGNYKYNSVRAIYDMGKEYEFSGLRIYQRVAGNQNITICDISISDDGKNWVKLDRHSMTQAVVAKIPTLKFNGETFNYKARYLKIDVVKTASGHWGLEEIRLLNPASGVDTKSPTALLAEIEAMKGDVKAIIDAYEPYNVEIEDAAAISAAKIKFTKLSSEDQATLDGDKLNKLYDAATQLSHNVRVNVIGLNDPSATNHNGQKGYKNVSYTLYVNDDEAKDVTVTGISYKDEAVSNNYDRWKAVNNGDGTVTLTLGGNYWNDPDWKGWIVGPMTDSIKSFESTGYYYRSVNAIAGLTSAPIEVRPESFTGTLVREITMKDEGDHHLTVTLSDGTEKEIILSAEYAWANLPSTAALGSKDADAITPSTSWKVATNLYEGTGNALKLFDGQYDANMYSTTWAFGGKYYTAFDENGNGTTTAGDTQLLAAPNDAIWIDFGTPTRMSGVRVHNRASNGAKIARVTVYGTNEINGDETEWKLLGEKKGSLEAIKEVTFKKNYTYRYIKINFAINAQSYTFLNEVAVLAPKTLLSSDANVTVDVAEGGLAQFKFDQGTADSKPASLKTESGSTVKATFDKGILTIDESVIAGLKNGTHTCIMTFTTGETFTLTVTKKDSSKVSYVLYSSNATGNLVLESPGAKDVKSLKFADGTEITKFTLSEDKKTITVVRQFFRQSKDLFADLDVDGTYVAELTATYEDDTTKTFYVTISANWTTATEVKGTYAVDEIYPDITKWKARVSTAADGTQAMGMLTKAAIKVKDAQNWHSFFGGVDGTVYGDSNGTIGHYIDIDFGENPAPYIGFRHLQRPAGERWINKNLVIMGKNAAGEDWTTIYNAVPTYTKKGDYIDGKGVAWAYYESDIRFEDEVTYRYIRIHVFSGTHATADTLHVLKKMASAENATAIVDKTMAEVAEFKFDLSSVAEGVIAVKAGETAVDAANYTFANGVLTFNAEYIASLPEGDTALTVTIDGWDNAVTITKVDKFTKSYAFTDTATGMGDYELKLYTLNGDTLTALKYGEADVPYTVENGEIVIARDKFRKLNDKFFFEDSANLTATYETAGEVTYKVNLIFAEYTLADVNGTFASDEIVPVYGTWKATVSSANAASHAINFFGMKDLGGHSYNWHTAYTVINGNEVVFENNTGYHYAEVDFGAATEFSGIRYYARSGDTSGDWSEVKLMGSNDDGATWEEIFDWTTTGISEEVRETTLKLGKNISYEKVRIYIFSGQVASGKGFAFLKPEKVVVNMKPTTGGDILIGNTPSQGTDAFEPGDEVTYTAKAEEGSEFMYWVEENTGRILGTEEALTLKAASGKDIKAVFADPASEEVFVSFFGRGATAVVSHAYVKKGETPVAPSTEKLYTTGYNFLGWAMAENAKEDDIVTLGAIEANSSFYAVYTAKEDKGCTVTVTNGKVRNAEGNYVESATFAYDKSVIVKADEAPEGMKFSHWMIGDEIVSYKEIYGFFAPDSDVAIVAVFVEEEAEIEETVSITMTKTLDEVNGVKVASFLTTRYVPEGTEVIETGVIYVKDASYDTLSISEVGNTSAAGKTVKVATCDKTTSGQYKLTASYVEGLGIKAVGFITYIDANNEVRTIYTAEMSQQ